MLDLVTQPERAQITATNPKSFIISQKDVFSHVISLNFGK